MNLEKYMIPAEEESFIKNFGQKLFRHKVEHPVTPKEPTRPLTNADITKLMKLCAQEEELVKGTIGQDKVQYFCDMNDETDLKPKFINGVWCAVSSNYVCFAIRNGTGRLDVSMPYDSNDLDREPRH